jgi:hypothetical protein
VQDINTPALKLSSIGLKSGEYGGRKRRTQPRKDIIVVADE